MNSVYGLTTDNLLRSFPEVLKKDKHIYALASSIAEILSTRTKEIDTLVIYKQIDKLPEPLLDILAYDFKVDWWDAEYTLEEKRKTLKDSWHVHRTLGTKYAVVTAISAIYKSASIQEWWEYDGAPYEFKLNINVDDSQLDVSKHRQVLERVNYYKNLRSVLGAIEYLIDPIYFINQPGLLKLYGMKFLIEFFNMPDGEVILLDARRNLNSIWKLNQVFSGMAFIRLSFLLAYKELNDFKVCFALGILSFQTAGKSDIYSIGVQTNFRNYEKAIYKKLVWGVCAKQENYLSAVCARMGVFTCKTVGNSQIQELMIQVLMKNQGHSTLQRLEWNVQAKQKYSLSATLTKDSMWWLNSEAQLNGKRNLNPRIIKEDI